MASAETSKSQSLEELKTQRLKEILNPARAGLLVVDLQNDFLAPDGKSAGLWHQNVAPMLEVLPRIEQVADLFRQQGRPVIFTKTYEDPELRTEAGRDRFLFFEENDKEEGVACLKGTPGADFFVPPKEEDIVIEKARLSAFSGTNLKDILAEQGIGSLFVVGLKTQRCIANTVQYGYDNIDNMHFVVLEDCVASDNQPVHDAIMEELKTFYPPMLASHDLFEAWSPDQHGIIQ
jgi:ureidoacrylate peracid hydrolase